MNTAPFLSKIFLMGKLEHGAATARASCAGAPRLSRAIQIPGVIQDQATGRKLTVQRDPVNCKARLLPLAT